MKNHKAKCNKCLVAHDKRRGWKWTKKFGLLCPDCARSNGIDPNQFGIKPLTKGALENYGV